MMKYDSLVCPAMYRKQQLYLVFLLLIIQMVHNQFDPPCSCERNRCECCLNAIVIDQEGCIRVTLNGSTIRISFVLNGDELGGFSIQNRTPFGGGNGNGVSVRIPCLPRQPTLAIRVAPTNAPNRLCLNVRLSTVRRTLYDNQFCFDVNGNSILNTFG